MTDRGPVRALSLRLPINPVPASRPRVSKWGTYYGKTYKRWRAAADKAIPSAPEPVFTESVEAQVYLVVQRPKTTKRSTPRGDIDNYLKAVFDAITQAGYWSDDDIVVKCLVTKRFTKEDEDGHCVVEIEGT